MTDIPVNIASNLAQRLVDRAINEARYLCRFKSYVEDFEKEKERLSAAREAVRKDIEEAKQRNENRIEDETQQWINEVDNLTQEDTQEKKKWFFGLCTDCIWQYGRGKELARKTLEIPKLMERRNNLRVARPVGPVGVEFHCLSNFMHFESRKAKFEELKEALKNSNNYLIGLQGMGGTGKTTMATQVGKEVEESKLFDKVIFTVVSNPPNVEKIRSDVARHLGLPLAEGKESKEHAESLWSRINNGGEKILIILDDVWDKELDLKVIGIPIGLHNKGCCSVFLTTRDLKVCKAMGCQETIQVDVLPHEEGLNLFLSHAIQHGVDSSSDFKDVALDIVKGCGGLPVAIEAIAKSIKSESLQVWKDTSTALQNFDPMLYDDVDGAMRKAYNCLKLSYDNLKNEKAQELFLLCSLFPEDFEIHLELLSRIAIGLGLCEEVDEYNKARSQVRAVKRKLVDSSLLLEDEEENIRMHDLVHEVAIKIANKEIQVVRDSKTTLKENVRFSYWIDGLPDRFDGSKLEILIIFITSFVKFPNALFEGMIKLRVLVINNDDWKIQGSLWVKSVQSLVNIRTLRLARLKLEDISCMENLQSLETLELFICSIVELPNEITKLENLKLLGLAGCTIERNNPFKVIERCLRLEELYYRYNYDIFYKKMEYDVRDIGIPPKLQMYDIIGEVNHFPIYYLLRWKASLLRRFKPSYLQNIFFEETLKFLAARAEILQLHGRYGTEWTNLIPDIASIEDGGMNDLIQLSLKFFPEMECLIDTKNIGFEVTIFSKLVELEFFNVGVKELCCGPFPSGFLKKLEKLHLYECSNLKGTLFKGKLDLGKLKCIRLGKCPMSSLFHPSTAQSLKQLEKLEIGQCRELKYIISNEGLGEDKLEDDTADPNEMSHGSMFSTLKIVDVRYCDKLEFIVPIHLGEDLPLLEYVNIVYCEKLKYIFGQQQDEGVSYQKGKEIKLPSLQKMMIYKLPNFINIFPAECCHPMSPVMKKSSTTKDDLKVKDPSLRCTFSWALSNCFMPKSTSTSIDNPIVSEEALPNRTGSQELKTRVFNPAQCFFRPPLDPRNMRVIEIRHCSNFTWLFTLSIASSMPLLEKLRVENCNGLKHIFTNDIDDDDHKKYSSIFPKLKEVVVSYCDLLESLFPASHFLTHLEVLRIFDTPKLRYVLGKCDCDDNLSHQSQPVQESRQDVPNKDTTKCFLRQPLNPLHLREMRISDCSNLTSLFTLSIASSMSLLESLYVYTCNGLKHIVTSEGDNGHDHMNYSSIFPNLKEIIIKGCSFLEYIFPASHCRSFNHLKSVRIIGVNNLRYVFGKCCCEDNLPLHNQNVEIHLPALQVLYLKNAPNMVSIGTQNCDFTALSLETVDSPPSLAGVFQGINFKTNIPPNSSTKIDDDNDDEYSKESHKEVVEYNGNPASETNSQLQEGSKAQVAMSKKKLSPSQSKQEVVENELAIQMKKNNTPTLAKDNFLHFQDTTKCLLRQPLNSLHLREMIISDCSNLTSLFTLSIASSMSLLESLEVKGCDGLKHIVTNEGDNGHDHMNCSSIFPNLKTIEIRNCSFLEYIFPASHCRSFNHLESVTIIGVNNLRYVFGKCYCEDNLPHHNQNVDIYLPALKVLLFDDVPNLVSIGTENYHFAALSLTKFECPPSLVGVFQGIDFQTNTPPTSSTKMDNDDNDEHSKETHQEIVEYKENVASETNSELQELPKVQAALPQKKLSPSQSKKEEVENELGIQMKNNNTPNLSKISKETEDSSVHGGPKLEKAITASEIIELEPSNSSSTPFVFPLQNESPQDKLVGKEAKNETIIIDQQAEEETRPNNNKVSSGEGSSSNKDNNTTSSAHSELEIASPHPLTSTEEFHEKESKGDQEALGESKQLDNTKKVDMEISNKTALASASNPIVTSSKDTSPLNIDASPGDGSSSKKQNKPITTTKISAISSSMKPQTASATTDPEPGVSQSNEADISGNAEFPQDKIIVNQSVIDNPQQFEEDDLIRLFRIMEKSADMEVHKLYVSKNVAVEDDNKVAKALADLEISLKMGLQEIASSEENSLRLQDALNFLSTHYCEDGDPSHSLKPTIESLHQEIPSILSSFKQVSARLSTIDTFTELEEKEKSVNEELPQRKDAAISLISEIYRTEKSMAMAQQKEAELKEQISRLQDELKNKGKEIKDCEIKLSFLQEQKKKSVSETIGFLEEFEAVKKDRSQIVEDKMRVRQELEKWSSCVAKWWKATLMQGIYLKH